MKMDCPTGLVCVDRPGTIDMRRLEPDAEIPGVGPVADKNGGKPEWWDVRVVGVTNRAEYDKITRRTSARYPVSQIKQKKTTGVIPTNLFLWLLESWGPPPR